MIGASIALALLFALLTLVSYVDRLYQEIGKFLSREFQDNIDAFEQIVEPRLKVTRQRASLSMAILTQLVTAAIAMIVGFTVFRDRAWSIYEVLEATLSLILIIIVFNRLLPFVFFSRSKGRWLGDWVLLLRILIYAVLPVTLVLGFCQSVAALTREHADALPETSSEAVDALIEAGQEEGIIQEGDRELIQSVVEFSGKTVREAMKPGRRWSRFLRLHGREDCRTAQGQAVLAHSRLRRIDSPHQGHSSHAGCAAGTRLRGAHADGRDLDADRCLLCPGKQVSKRPAARDAAQ